MKLFKKIFTSALAVTVAAGSFAVMPAGAASDEVEQNASLKVWVSDAEVKLTKSLCSSFAEKYKSKNVKISVAAMGEDSAATGALSDPESAADVFSAASDQLFSLVSAKAISPLNSSYASSVKKSESKESVKAVTYNKKLYAHPKTGNGYFLVYNKKVVSAKQAKTLEGILKACKKKGKKFIMDASNGYYSSIFLFTGGAKLNGLSPDGMTQKFTKYNKKTVVKTLKAFSTLIHKYSSVFKNADVSGIRTGFVGTSSISGKCGAGIDGNWNYQADKTALGKNLGAAKLPTIKVGSKKRQIISMFGYKANVVNSFSKYPKAAQTLAAYLSSKSAQKKRLTSLDWNPTNKSLSKSAAVKRNPLCKAMTEQSKYSVAQASVSMLFWDPCSYLGTKITAKSTNPKTFNFSKLLSNTIKNIKG